VTCTASLVSTVEATRASYESDPSKEGIILHTNHPRQDLLRSDLENPLSAAKAPLKIVLCSALITTSSKETREAIMPALKL
jgi:hypothetical protein